MGRFDPGSSRRLHRLAGVFGEPTDLVAEPNQQAPAVARHSARAGRALLQGLLLCAGCGRRLSPRYTGNAGIYPLYECTARHQDTIYRKDCVTIQAGLVDQAISRRVLEVLQPEQLEIALRALKELEERSEAIDGQWRMRIERLEYQAQLAQRRYEEVDPSYRLVAATLEKRWNEALEELQRLKDDYQKHRQQQGFELTSQQKAELRALAEDLPRLWQAQTTSAKDRKRMLRLLIKDVTVEKRRSERKALLHIRWRAAQLRISVSISHCPGPKGSLLRNDSPLKSALWPPPKPTCRSLRRSMSGNCAAPRARHSPEA